MKSFSIDYVKIENDAMLMWWDQVDAAEEEYDSDFIQPPRCKVQKSGNIIIHGELNNGHNIAISFNGSCWRPRHES